MNTQFVIPRHGELYIDHQPLDWVVPPRTVRYDRKRAWFEFDLPEGTRVEVFDGFGKHVLRVGGEACEIRFHASRAIGLLTLEE